MKTTETVEVVGDGGGAAERHVNIRIQQIKSAAPKNKPALAFHFFFLFLLCFLVGMCACMCVCLFVSFSSALKLTVGFRLQVSSIHSLFLRLFSRKPSAHSLSRYLGFPALPWNMYTYTTPSSVSRTPPHTHPVTVMQGNNIP